MAEDAGISWHIDSHEHQERSTDWYWGLGLTALAAAGVSIFFGNYLFALILLLGLGSLGILIARGPREHEVKVNPRGLSLDGTLYRWSQVENFWVEDERALPAGRQAHLLLTTKGILHPQIIVPLNDQTRAQNVRQYLRRFAQEHEQEAHLGHHVAQMLGL